MTTLLEGRLGIADSRIAQKDRHGLVWLLHGHLRVVDGTLHFFAAETAELPAGDYAIPYQGVSMILLGPGTTVSHDALRILSAHGTLLAAVAEGGVKLFTAPPVGQGRSDVARAHARLWCDGTARAEVARRMFEIRFGTPTNGHSLAALRGIEGARMKTAYRLIAERYRVPWNGRIYDREHPEVNDVPNQAINFAATFMEGAAEIAVAAAGALPPLGFLHEDPFNAFVLDIADLYRTEITLPLAFSHARLALNRPEVNLERAIRFKAAEWFREHQVIDKMIDQIKSLLRVHDDRRHP